MSDQVNHPAHYNSHPSCVECIDIAENLGYNLGNCFKYLYRAPHKDNRRQDLEKARWYFMRWAVYRYPLPAFDIRTGTLLKQVLDHEVAETPLSCLILLLQRSHVIDGITFVSKLDEELKLLS